MKRFLLPLGLFAVLVGFLLVGLRKDPHEIPSPLIDKAAPAFALPVLDSPATTLSPLSLRGQVWMLNVWASWCETCREEHEVLVDMARRKVLPIYGLDYKDNDADARRWLGERGNPYVAVALDRDGRTGIEYGVYGVPESYLIDRQGVIRYKQIGALTPDVLEQKIMPLIRELQKP